jgi:hypothetical protein
VKDADADRRLGIVEADGKEAVVAVEEDGEVAGLALVAQLTDSFRIHPGMPALHRALGTRMKPDGEPAAARYGQVPEHALMIVRRS